MKFVKLLSLTVLSFLATNGVNGQWEAITNLTGTTQNYNGVDVTVTSQGGITGGGCIGLYWITGNNNFYRYDFSVPVAGVRLVIDAVNQGETVEFEVNGNIYPIVICDFDTAGMQNNMGCYLNTCSILNNQLVNDGTISVCGAGLVFYGPVTSFKIRTPVNTSGPTFNISFAPLGNNITNIANCGINNSIGNSFSVYNSKTCAGPNFNVFIPNYLAGMTLQTIFGDGTSQTAVLTPVLNSAYTMVSHVYPSSGNYTIKQVLFSGGIPIDSMLFPYQHKFCSTMSLDLFYDANANCAYDSGVDANIFLPVSVEVDSVGVSIDTISCTSGFTYTAYGNAGNIYSFKILSLPGNIIASCPVTGVVNDTLQVGVNDPKFMGFACTSGSNFDLNFNVDSRAGSHAFEANITPRNEFCAAQNAVLTMNYNTAYTSFNASPPPASQSLGVATWNLNGITALAQFPTIHVHLDGAQWPVGISVSTTYTITPTTGDLVPGDNTVVVVDTTEGGYDPNAIYVTPEGCVTAGTNLEYKITFENMGNGLAENIYVLDTLPAGLDVSSMKLKFASHSMFIEKIYNGPQTILKFNFPNIMLPDSSSPDRHGSFVYTINTLNSLPFGTNIYHGAGIYFDYNPPVLTNTAHTAICWPQNVETTTSASGGQVLIYPNPATDELTIEADGSFTAYTITNNLGQVMISEKLKGKTTHSISSLPAGVYYITVEGEKGRETLKFVKL